MNFTELIKKVNTSALEDQNEIFEIVDNININNDNIEEWTNNVCSDKISLFDMNKLPLIIDELYKTNDKLKFFLCCMLLDSACNKLKFIPNLENYSLFLSKMELLIPTLVNVYEKVDNGIDNCMSLIIINNDPEFKHFDNELKKRIIIATRRKLNNILNYLKTQNINSDVSDYMGIIIDMSCYLKDEAINKIINDIDNLVQNDVADLFIIKYKIINNLNIKEEQIQKYINDNNKLIKLYCMMEELGVHNKYLNGISQEKIALSDMISWLSYPTELGSAPDNIELLGEFIYNNTKCFAFKFNKNDFIIKGDLIGVSGGYPINQISSITSGCTFSKFEILTENWKKQAVELVNFISGQRKSKVNND